jgi:hypothetical protein
MRLKAYETVDPNEEQVSIGARSPYFRKRRLLVYNAIKRPAIQPSFKALGKLGGTTGSSSGRDGVHLGSGRRGRRSTGTNYNKSVIT